MRSIRMHDVRVTFVKHSVDERNTIEEMRIRKQEHMFNGPC